MFARTWILRLTITSLGIAASCDTALHQPPDSGEVISPICLEARDHSDLDWIQENIFTNSCAKFRACHKGAALSAEGLNLEVGMAAGELLNKPSRLFPDRILVIPGDSRNSYLMVQLGTYDGPHGEGGLMPFNNPLLCLEKRDAVERWINAAVAPTEADAGGSAGPDAGLDAGPDAGLDAGSTLDAAPPDAAIPTGDAASSIDAISL